MKNIRHRTNPVFIGTLLLTLTTTTWLLPATSSGQIIIYAGNNGFDYDVTYTFYRVRSSSSRQCSS